MKELKEKDERIKDLNREITDLMEREKDWKRRIEWNSFTSSFFAS